MAATKIEASNIAAGAVASTGFTSVQVFTAAATWTRPTDITKVIVEVQGAGGGGARGNTAASTMGAGGGGYAKKFCDVSSITTSTILVGAYGAASTGEPTGAGSGGGISSWTDGTNTLTGNGGAAGTNAGYGAGVAGGTGTGGDINIQGGRGQAGGDATPAGGSFLGVTAKANESYGNPNSDALGYGAGGGGGYNQHSGDGAPGVVIVWEFK